MKKSASLDGIRSSSDEDLRAQLKRLEEELFQNHFKRHTNQLENTNVLSRARREIARVKTILAARQKGHETRTEAKAQAAE